MVFQVRRTVVNITVVVGLRKFSHISCGQKCKGNWATMESEIDALIANILVTTCLLYTSDAADE